MPQNSPLKATAYEPRHKTEEQRRLRVLSYNIQVGISSNRYSDYMTHGWKHVLPFRGRQDNLDNTARFIKDFDLVGLQELDAGSLRSGFINQTKYLATVGHFPYWYNQTNRNLGKFAQHSQGLLSQFRPFELIEHRLPSTIPGRGALEARFGDPQNPLIVIHLHLSLSQRARERQFDYIARQTDKHEHVIVMGDMNCQPHSRELQQLLNSTHLCEPLEQMQTYPSWSPEHCLDHILVTSSIGVEGARAYSDVNHSDHLPISLDLLLPAKLDLNHTQSSENAISMDQAQQARLAAGLY